MTKIREWMSWIREHRKDWPVLVALMVFCLNIELVVTPYILGGLFGLSEKKLRIAAGSWSSVELVWWIWFSIWLFREKIRKNKTVNQAIEIGRDFVDNFTWQEFLVKKPGDSFLVRNFKDIVAKRVKEFDLDNYKDDGAFMVLFGYAKGLGYAFCCLLVFVFGLMPLFWILGLMICRLVKRRFTYLALFISNFIKNYYFAVLYERIGFWWLLAAFILMVIMVSFILKKFMNILRNKSKK